VPELGIFLVPQADAESTIGIAAEDGGLDYVAIQDHPLRIAELGFEAIMVVVPPGDGAVEFVRRRGEDVAPQVREGAA
jgi:hypothetical protein